MCNVIFILFYYYYYFLSIVKRLALKRISAVEMLLYRIVLYCLSFSVRFSLQG